MYLSSVCVYSVSPEIHSLHHRVIEYLSVRLLLCIPWMQIHNIYDRLKLCRNCTLQLRRLLFGRANIYDAFHTEKEKLKGKWEIISVFPLPSIDFIWVACHLCNRYLPSVSLWRCFVRYPGICRRPCLPLVAAPDLSRIPTHFGPRPRPGLPLFQYIFFFFGSIFSPSANAIGERFTRLLALALSDWLTISVNISFMRQSSFWKTYNCR